MSMLLKAGGGCSAGCHALAREAQNLRSCLSAKAQLGVCQQKDNKFDKSGAADGYESFTSGLDQQAV